MKKIKSLFIIGALALAGAITTQAQTTTTNFDANGNEIITIHNGTNVLSSAWYAQLYQPILSTAQSIASASNIVIAPFGMTLTSGAKSGTWGGGVLALYNLNNYIGTGVGIYYLGQWFDFNGTVQLQLPIVFSSNIVLTPFIAGGIGTSFAGAGNANGDIDVISQMGVNADLFTIGGWRFGTGGFFGTISGAGQYSGDDAGFFAKISKGF